jgi:ELWxxDGT repeat protein
MSNRSALALAAVLTLTALTATLPLSAQTATLVKDINTNGPVDFNNTSSSPQNLTAVGSKVFFTADEPSSGRQVWVSDGTSAGTELLHDLSGPDDGQLHVLGPLRGLFLWTLVRGSFGVTLMRSDGTRPGTFEIFPGSTGLTTYGPDQGASVIAGDRLYFAACQSADCHLWMSDGTAAGTRPVPGSPGSILVGNGSGLVAVGNRVFFLSGDVGHRALWISDGTAAGTHAVKDVPDIRRLTAAGNRLYFTSFPGGVEQLWTSDGTPAGTIAVSHFATVPPFQDNVSFLPSGNSVFFAARSAAGEELWTSDGTPAGTRRLTDFPEALPFNGFYPGTLAAANGRPVFLTRTDHPDLFRLWTAAGGKAVPLTTAPVARSLYQGNGKVFFIASDGGHGFEPWVSDGTVAGTHLLKDICPGACDSGSTSFVTVAGVTYFSEGDLWRTDGTEAGTRRITRPPFSIDSFGGFELAAAGGKLFMSFDAPPYGKELWVHDETGEHIVTDIARSIPGSAALDLVSFGSRLFFTACDGAERSLWQSSGNGASPFPATAARCTYPFGAIRWGLTAGGSLLYFLRADDDQHPAQLWRSDGTEAGTFQLTDLPNGVVLGDNSNLGFDVRTLFQGKLLFATRRILSGGGSVEEIWESDGTIAGTRKSPYLPGNLTDILYMRTVGDEIYFFATDDDQITGLWRSDGTAAGTRKVAPLYTGTGGDPQFTRLDGAVFFLAYIPGSRRQLWRTDGTLDGTQAILNVDSGQGDSYLADFTLFQGSLYIFAEDSSGNETLLRSNGTPAGMVPLKVFAYPRDYSGDLLARHSFTSAAGRLFFRQADDAHGVELWSTDGTPEGTALVKDVFPGQGSGNPDGLTSTGDRVFFSAHDGERGIELWQSDGTAAGTRLVQDIAPEALSSRPDQLTVAGDRLYFTADDGQFGRELWSLPLAGPSGCQASSARLCLNGNRYQVEASWNDGQGHTGLGTAVALSADTGYFWFFDSGNVEAVVKVLDGQGVNGHVWVFYGALSNVEYTLTVTDTQTGLTRRYFNPQGQLASVGDVHAFGPLGAKSKNPDPLIFPASPSAQVTVSTDPREIKAACDPAPGALCLNGGRFAVTVAWKDFQGHTGQGTAVPLSDNTGTFWFFNAANVELVVKVLDGRPVNNHLWLFYGALSNVEYTLTVTDVQTGTKRTYTNPSGRFASVADTQAF